MLAGQGVVGQCPTCGEGRYQPPPTAVDEQKFKYSLKSRLPKEWQKIQRKCSEHSKHFSLLQKILDIFETLKQQEKHGDIPCAD
jgi:hypothetical protein